MSILQLLASSVGDDLGNVGRTKSSDLVGQIGRGEGSLGGRVDGAAEVDVLDNGVSSLLGVGKEDGTLDRVGKGGALDENLGTHAGVDAREEDAVPVVVDDVDGGEADQGLAAVDVLPVVVGVGDAKLALVLTAVGVRVADQRTLPLENSQYVIAAL